MRLLSLAYGKTWLVLFFSFSSAEPRVLEDGREKKKRGPVGSSVGTMPCTQTRKGTEFEDRPTKDRFHNTRHATQK